MCAGVECKDGKRIVRVYFPSPRAALPVRLKSGATSWLAWGRREGENPAFPQGSWARLESIQDGKREKFKPRPVVIAAQIIQGLVASYGTETRLYVVTTRAPRELPDWHDRWPRLVTIAA